MKTVHFFGYGVLSNRNTVAEIIRRNPGPGHPATVEGYQLVTQNLTHIPDSIKDTLKRAWKTDQFKAYTLNKSGGGTVAGVIWELTEEEVKKIMRWEFVGLWREGITEKAKISSTGEIVTVQITKAINSRENEGAVKDSLRYEINLNPMPFTDNETREREQSLVESVRRQIQELASQGAYGKQSFA
jgi:hypothetical protein